MKYDVRRCRVLSRKTLTPDIFDYTVDAGSLAEHAQPGQFAQIYVPGKTLRRPISICFIDKEKQTFRFVFQNRGEGTAILSETMEGGEMDILAPLGNGFPLGDTSRRAVFVGGGIGVPPLLGAAAAYGGNATAVLGFRTAGAVILSEDFEALGCTVRIATEDGSMGQKGFVTDCLRDMDADVVFTCGPTPMLRAVAKLARERGMACLVSLEERMACGIGACLGCAVELRGEGGAVRMGHVCKDGPVFDANQLAWEVE